MKSIYFTVILTIFLSGCAFSNSGMLSTESTIGNANTNTKNTIINENKEAIVILKDELKNTNIALDVAFKEIGKGYNYSSSLEKKIANLEQKVKDCNIRNKQMAQIKKDITDLEAKTSSFISKLKQDQNTNYQSYLDNLGSI